MLRLFILRHAKSSWTTPGQTDFERGLNERGIADLAKIASAMGDRGYLPDFVYCSKATRTQQTAEGIFDRLLPKPQIEFLRSMYSGGMSAYLDILRDHKADQSLMIIGHNPTCHALATYLVRDGEAMNLSSLSLKYPTGTLSVLDFDIDSWAELKEHTGQLVDLIHPKKLPA